MNMDGYTLTIDKKTRNGNERFRFLVILTTTYTSNFCVIICCSESEHSFCFDDYKKRLIFLGLIINIFFSANKFYYNPLQMNDKSRIMKMKSEKEMKNFSEATIKYNLSNWSINNTHYKRVRKRVK